MCLYCGLQRFCVVTYHRAGGRILSDGAVHVTPYDTELFSVDITQVQYCFVSVQLVYINCNAVGIPLAIHVLICMTGGVCVIWMVDDP